MPAYLLVILKNWLVIVIRLICWVILSVIWGHWVTTASFRSFGSFAVIWSQLQRGGGEDRLWPKISFYLLILTKKLTSDWNSSDIMGHFLGHYESFCWSFWVMGSWLERGQKVVGPRQKISVKLLTLKDWPMSDMLGHFVGHLGSLGHNGQF